MIVLLALTAHATIGTAPESLRRLSGTSTSLPIARSIVAVGDGVRANGLVWGPRGCFVVTTFQAAFSTSPKRFKTYDWIYGSRGDFLRSALSHRIVVDVDFDLEREQFRQRLEGQVVAYGDFRQGDSSPQPQRDWVILRLYRPGTVDGACVGTDTDARQLSTIGSMPAEVALNRQHLLAIKRRNGGGTTLVTTTYGCDRADRDSAYCFTHEVKEGSLAIERDKFGDWKLLGLVAEQGILSGSGFPVYAVPAEVIDRALLRYLRSANLANDETEAYFRAPAPFLGK